MLVNNMGEQVLKIIFPSWNFTKKTSKTASQYVILNMEIYNAQQRKANSW